MNVSLNLQLTSYQEPLGLFMTPHQELAEWTLQSSRYA